MNCRSHLLFGHSWLAVTAEHAATVTGLFEAARLAALAEASA